MFRIYDLVLNYGRFFEPSPDRNNTKLAIKSSTWTDDLAKTKRMPTKFMVGPKDTPPTDPIGRKA
jgi:hypothetical protein